MTWTHNHLNIDFDSGDVVGFSLPHEDNYLSNTYNDSASGLITFNQGIVINSTTNTASGQDGKIIYTQGELFFYDGTRSKYLSLTRQNFVFNRNGVNQKSQYLKIGETVSSSTGIKMPRSGTILKISANSRNNSNVNYQIRKNGVETPLGNLSIINAKGGFSNYVNLDFKSNDDLQIYMDVQSGNVDYPIVWLEIAWKVNGGI